MKYGYARCSTNESRQDINRQKRELKSMGLKRIISFLNMKAGQRMTGRN